MGGLRVAPSAINGAPVLAGALGWVAGAIEQEIEAGDHLIFLVAVSGISTEVNTTPLLFYLGAYHELAQRD